MRADIRRMLVKGKNKQLVDKIIAYVALKPATERVIITRDQHAALVRCANMGNVVLCCGDTIVHYDYEPIDESYHAPTPVPRYKAELPPVVVNPFGVTQVVAKPVPPPLDSYNEFADDDIPF